MRRPARHSSTRGMRRRDSDVIGSLSNSRSQSRGAMKAVAVIGLLACLDGWMLGPADRGTDRSATSGARKSRTTRPSFDLVDIDDNVVTALLAEPGESFSRALQEIRQAAAAEDRRRRRRRRVDLGSRRRRPVRRIADRPRVGGLAQRHHPGTDRQPRRRDQRAVCRPRSGRRPPAGRGAADDRAASRRKGDRAAGDRDRDQEPLQQRDRHRRGRGRRQGAAVAERRSAARPDRRGRAAPDPRSTKPSCGCRATGSPRRFRWKRWCRTRPRTSMRSPATC